MNLQEIKDGRDDIQHTRDLFIRAGKTLLVAAIIVAGLWLVTGNTGKRLFVQWGDQTIEVTPVPSAYEGSSASGY